MKSFTLSTQDRTRIINEAIAEDVFLVLVHDDLFWEDAMDVPEEDLDYNDVILLDVNDYI